MSPEDERSLETWVALSREMVELAQADEWEQLTKRESVRQQQIRSFFQRQVSPADVAQLKASIEQVMVMDATVQQLAEQARSEAARELVELRRNSQAVKAYATQSRSVRGRN